MQNMIWYLLWAIGPLIPAIVLYKVLPMEKTDANVNGKLQGLRIKLGGAGALYFIIFFVMNPVRLGLIDKDMVQDRWQLVTSFKNAGNQPVSPDQIRSIEPIPNYYDVLDNERVMVMLPTVSIDKEKNVSMPYRLRFTFADYEPQTISSSDYFNKANFCDIKWNDREICLKNLPRLVPKPKETAHPTDTEMAKETIIN
jgi:hypothetical protein